ncbi:MAG TPA: RNA polymerase factor sigma-54 [Aliidongia sp.]|nr:RNA polymerase factor sigma-54 [Aliidongia sp.]
MALSQRLDLRQTQSLVMTPQLQQAIKLLQLSNLELMDYVEQEIEQNPLLERDESVPEPAFDGNGVDPAEAPAAPVETTASLDGASSFESEDKEMWQAASGADGQGTLDYAGDAEAWKTRNSQLGGGDDLPSLEETLSDNVTLREHLVGQLNCDIEEPGDRIIGLFMIDVVDDAGYLTTDLADIARTLGCTIERAESVLARLQRFDPSGIFARNLSECLAIQLREKNRLDPCMQTLLNNLPLLAAREIGPLLRLCSCDSEDLAQMVAEIKALNPKPGLAFDGTAAQPVVPDIMMRAQPGGGWLIELNNDTLPRVLVNTHYYAKINRNVGGKLDRDYLSERFQSANWLVKSLHQRAGTILKVATEIVRQQEAFFTHGVGFLRPLILRDIAEAIGMHESTVSRVTTNKYIATPRGLFELKYFFTSAIPAANGAEAHSAEAVKFKIKGLIDAEAAAQVLSDDRLVELLREVGIDIARRTVAKYREAMRIPSSVLRRREKSLGM